MRRSVILAAVVVLIATVASAKDYPSSFGFTFSAPDTWLIMTKPELASNPVFASTDPGIKAKVESGSEEFLYNRATSDPTFADNVNMRMGGGTIPSTPDTVKDKCTRYAHALAKAAGRPLAVARCEERDLGPMKTFYVEYEGRVNGTVTMQYQLARPDGKLVFVTATCKQSSLDKFRPDFDAIVKSIHFR